jgi:hypothetical protein
MLLKRESLEKDLEGVKDAEDLEHTSRNMASIYVGNVLGKLQK